MESTRDTGANDTTADMDATRLAEMARLLDLDPDTAARLVERYRDQWGPDTQPAALARKVASEQWANEAWPD